MTIFGTTLSALPAFFVCAAAALLLGAVLAFFYAFKNKRYTRSFVWALFSLPVAVATVLLLVGSNWGAAVAIGGVFALVRFRSLPASAKQIVSVFLAMVVGVACANAYSYANSLIVALVLTVVACVVFVLFNTTSLGESGKAQKTLRVTIPESLDYTEVFDDLFEKYTAEHDLLRVKTTNMGTMFQLTYLIVLKDAKQEREFLNELRCRNGNLDIICARVVEDEKTL